MKPALRDNLAITALILALMIAAYQAEPWTAAVISALFVFVLFPRWRGKVAALIEKGFIWVTKKFRHDCDDHR